MRRIVCIAVVILGCGAMLWAQEPLLEPPDWAGPPSFLRFRARYPRPTAAPVDDSGPAVPDAPSAVSDGTALESESSSRPAPEAKADYAAAAAIRPGVTLPPPEKFHWGPAIRQSLFFLFIEHGFRLGTQKYTRKRTVEGKFFDDWGESIAGIQGWDDHDAYYVNYIGHPMQGAITSYIQIQNDPQGIRQEFGSSPEYWKSRLKGMAWAAVFSTQFEIGPLSEATLGNVGQKKGTGGAVDLVMTPVAGLGFTVMEDAVDKYVIRDLEGKSRNRGWRALARTVLNPSRSFANLLRKRAPWHRDTRDGISFVARETPRPAAAPAAAESPAAAATRSEAASSCTQPCP